MSGLLAGTAHGVAPVRGQRVGCLALGLCAALAIPSVWAQSEAVTTAETPPESVDRPDAPSAEAVVYATARAQAANAYGTCLEAHKGGWITAPDYSACAGERSAYARYLPVDAAELVLGCLEEQVVGSARTEGMGCEAREARFVEPEAAAPSDALSTEAVP